jgi:two-component system response regulator
MDQQVEILMVEDDPADVELTLSAFREHNLANNVRVARDGEEALEYLFGDDATTVWPKCVLLDLKLPKIGGLEVLKRIKSDPKTKSIPVIILTSSREAPDMKAAYELGANSYLCKPVEFQSFVEIVKQIEMYWLLTNQPPQH